MIPRFCVVMTPHILVEILDGVVLLVFFSVNSNLQYELELLSYLNIFLLKHIKKIKALYITISQLLMELTLQIINQQSN